MPDKTVDAYDRDTREPSQVRAGTSEFKGSKYFSLRGWFLEEKTQEYRPGKNGINLPVEEYPAFRELIAALDEELGYTPGGTDA